MCHRGYGIGSANREAKGHGTSSLSMDGGRGRLIQRSADVGWIAVVLMWSVAWTEFEIGYFQGRVNEATEQAVASRYGPPHKVEQREGYQTVWMYFDRGVPPQAMLVRPVQPLPRLCADI
jgi:hypothetical protein